MKISESCAKCLYDKQAAQVKDEAYLRRVREIIDRRGDSDSAPYLVYLFSKLHEEMFGSAASYADVKKKYNDLILSLEGELRMRIERADDPLAAALQYARIGNYIDFGAMDAVDEDEFLSLFARATMSEQDKKVYASFISQCESARSFLLISDNCGEIVLDKLFIEQLKKRFPQLTTTVLVRGGEALNDATAEDAEYVGMPSLAKVIDNGLCLAGTVYALLPEEARVCIDRSDVILSKGQGNYESLSGISRHVFYSFLCKCDLFTSRFDVPRFTGIFIEE